MVFPIRMPDSLTKLLLALVWPLLCLTPGGTRAHAAAPQLKAFSPAGVRIGAETVLTVDGTFDRWPMKVQLEGQAAGIQVTASETKGQLRVQVDPDAVPGICWLRLYDERGVTTARPLFVDQLPTTLEKEPNDEPAAATPVELPAIAQGVLAKSGEVDGYRLSLRAGQTLVAAVTAHNVLGSPMDCVLQVCDPAGFVLAQNDDARGLDPLLAFPVPADGEYLVRLFAFPETPNSTIGFAGGATFAYRLSLTTGPFIDHLLPLAVDREEATPLKVVGWNLPAAEPVQDGPTVPAGQEQGAWVSLPGAAEAIFLPTAEFPQMVATGAVGQTAMPQELPLPAVISGSFQAAGPHRFRFQASKGTKLRFAVDARKLGFELDPQLKVLAEDGKQLAAVDDSNRQPDCSLDWAPPADGHYLLEVSDLHSRSGPRFAYRLTAAPVQPAVAASFSQEVLVVPPGKSAELAVAVERRDGYNQELEIAVEGLPDGVQVAAVRSAAKGDTAKQVTLKFEAKGEFVAGSCRILVRELGEAAGPPAAASLNQSAAGRPSGNLWLARE